MDKQKVYEIHKRIQSLKKQCDAFLVEILTFGNSVAENSHLGDAVESLKEVSEAFHEADSTFDLFIVTATHKTK